MTPEEQKVFDAMKAENEQLKENQRKQNQYITQLEAKAKGAPAPTTAPAGTPNDGLDDVYKRFIEGQMREQTLAKAVAFIKQRVSAEEYTAVEADFLGFLDNNMTAKNCTQDFIVDAFNLVMGRARMNAEHAINKVGKGGTPTATPTPTTNGQTIAQVQSVIASQPPVMSDKDKGAASGNPVPTAPPGIKSTKDAFAALGSKFASAGGNKYQ